MMLMTPRYPDIRIRLHSRNPFALVSAVRFALRRSQVDLGEIERFTEEALRDEDPRHVQQVCAAWAAIEVPAPRQSA